jgi:CRP/FNR family cyclic AMP-dependent transcriptional regulator
MLLMFRQDLMTLEIFKGLRQEQIELLCPLVDHASFADNQVIFDQGQSADYLYILKDGEVEIRYKPYDGPYLTVARILAGGVFGWSAALHHESYTSAAVSTCRCSALRITGEKLQKLCEAHPETGVIILERLAEVISERLHATHEQVLKLLSGRLGPDLPNQKGIIENDCTK